MSNPKTICAAFGCKRWTRKFPKGWEFMCQSHWQMVSKRMRALHRKAVKKVRDNEGNGDNAYNRYREWRIWRKCVDQANRNIGMP